MSASGQKQKSQPVMLRSALPSKPDMARVYEYTPRARAFLNSRPSRLSKTPSFWKKSQLGGSRLCTADPETLRMVYGRRANSTLQGGIETLGQLVSVFVTPTIGTWGLPRLLSARSLDGSSCVQDADLILQETLTRR
jgi:hypothetical protein